MPTYVYRFVKTGETIEVQQAFTDEPLTAAVHPRSGRKMAVKKVFTPVGVTFRGGGFYKTDSRKSATNAKSSKSDGAGEATTSSDSKSTTDSKPSSTEGSSNGSTKSDNKSETKAAAAAP